MNNNNKKRGRQNSKCGGLEAETSPVCLSDQINRLVKFQPLSLQVIDLEQFKVSGGHVYFVHFQHKNGILTLKQSHTYIRVSKVGDVGTPRLIVYQYFFVYQYFCTSLCTVS